eukprot:snap_masked-scaffold_10-processed-gene-5.27-mRNA-1 protein AED:1.00 eAED:1.00 QI:0/0/0/0/1/1/3/0/324
MNKTTIIFFLSYIVNIQAETLFKIATYNVFNYDDGADWEERQLLIRDNIQEANPDFIGLQEIRHDLLCYTFLSPLFCFNNAYDDLIELLEPLGYTYHGFNRASLFFPSYEGLAYFSKYEVLSETPQLISTGLAARLAVHIEIFVPDYGAVNMFNTHWSTTDEVRLENAVELGKFIREIGEDGEDQFIFFVLGDLNTETESFDGLLDETFPTGGYGDTDLIDTHIEGGNTFCNCKVDGSECDTDRRIDYVLAQDIVNVEIVETGTLNHPDFPEVCPSDHKIYFAQLLPLHCIIFLCIINMKIEKTRFMIKLNAQEIIQRLLGTKI